METNSAQFVNMLMDRIQALEVQTLLQSRQLMSAIDSITALKTKEPVVIRADEDDHSKCEFSVHYHVVHETGDRFFRKKSAACDYLNSTNQTGYVSHVPTATMNNRQYYRILLHPQPLCIDHGVVEQ